MSKAVFIVDIDSTLADHSHRLPLLKKYCSQCGKDASAGITLHTINLDTRVTKQICSNCDCDVLTIPTQSWANFCQPHLMANDAPIEKAKAVLAKARAVGTDIHFITGRSEDSRVVTEEWLTKHFGFDKRDSKLLMRAENTYTGRGVNHLPASLHKQWCFHELRRMCGYYGSGFLFMFFDDDMHVLDMYKQFGLTFKAPDCWDSMVFEDQAEPELLFSR